MDSMLAYIPEDRRHALAHGGQLPAYTVGAALFADISGFTPLTEALRLALGPRQGSEALSDQLNRTYTALIAQVNAYRGSVLGFAGDAITCWFDAAAGPAAPRAVACAVALQHTMAAGDRISLPDGSLTMLALKVAVVCGPARRMIVGDPAIQILDLLGGMTLARVAVAEHHATAGEIVLDAAAIAAVERTATIGAWREDAALGEAFAPLYTFEAAPPTDPWPDLPAGALSSSALRPWLLPAIYARELAAQGSFLTELRPAVALFVRFTGIDYDGDPTAPARLDALIRAVQAVLTRYDGALLQVVIGDKGNYLCCAFGTPAAHEDDAHRAVLAALALQAVAVVTCDMPPLQIGISQGVMRCGVYGSTRRSTYGILSNEVNLAARLMSLAEPGEILVCASVYASVSNRIALEPRTPVQIKGQRERQPVFLVAGLRHEHVVRLMEPGYTLPMVGRDDELALSKEVLAQALAGHGQVLGISAEAGLGKSRLVSEIVRIAGQQGMTCYAGGCQSTSTDSPYVVWQAIWRGIFDLDPTLPLQQQLPALAELVTAWAPVRAAAIPLLGPLLGLAVPENDFTQRLDPKDRQGALHALLCDCLAGAARTAQTKGGGLLIVIEDAHWLDAASGDLLNDLVHAFVGLPVLLVLAYRPPDPTQPYILPVEELPHFHALRLSVLADTSIAQMIELKLRQIFPARADAVPANLLAQFIARAQGNPFYIEELLNYMHDQGRDPRDEQTITDLALPDSLHRLILSRIDRLSGQQQVLLKVASVIGRRFLVAWLCGAFPTLVSPAAVSADLDQLAQLDLIPLDTPAPELAYLFKHVITREVAYESIGAAMRTTLHGQMAEYLEQRAEAHADQLLDVLAYHYEQSNNLPKKRLYLRRAGEAAAARYANAAALAYLSRALDLAPRDDLAERYALLVARETIYDVLGERTQQATDLDQLHHLAERLADPQRRAEVALHYGRYAERTSDYPAAIRAAEAAVTWAQEARCTDLEATARQRWGWALLRQQDYAKAREQLEQSLHLIQAGTDQRRICQTLTDLGTLALDQGAHAEARVWYTQSLQHARTLGNRRQEARVLGNLGTLFAEQGDVLGAQSALVETLTAADMIGDQYMAGITRSNLGFLCIMLGDYAGARGWIEQSLIQLRAIGDRRLEAVSLGNLGLVALHQGAYAEAQTTYAACLVIAQTIGDEIQSGWAQRGLGSAALGAGDLVTAEAAYRQSLATLRSVGTPALIAEALAGLAQVALAVGDAPVALAHVEAILAHLETGTLDGAEEPMAVYLACYQALQANGDLRAPTLLRRARTELRTRAEQIPDSAARQQLLEQVPAHRALLTA